MVNLALIRRNRTTINIADVLPSPYNPPIRTANRTGDIDDLGASIRNEGQLEPVHAVYDAQTKKYYLADGNRRREGMLKEGFTKIEAIVYDPGQENVNAVVAALFVKLNDEKRRLANRDMVEVGLAGGPIFNGTVKGTVEYFNRLWPTGIPSLIKLNAGSTVLNGAKRVVKYCWPGFSPGSQSFDGKLRVVLLWIVRNKQQQQAIAYMRMTYSPDALKRAIEADRLVPRMNG